MAVPTRPAQDAIIDPVWGQWVHDSLLDVVHWKGNITLATDGAGIITAAMLGLTNVAGAVVAVASGTAAAPMFCNGNTDAGGGGVWITGFSLSGGVIIPWGAGTLPFTAVAWGTYTPGATTFPSLPDRPPPPPHLERRTSPQED